MIYCNKCGTANYDSAIYCSHDGYALKTVEMNSSVELSGSQFCGQCGEKNTSDSIYCSNCGRSLEKVSEGKSPAFGGMSTSLPTVNLSGLKKGFQNKEKLKTALIGSLIAIVIVFLGSFLFSKMAEENILRSFDALGPDSPTEIYEEFLEEAEYFTGHQNEDMRKDLNPFKTTNLVMVSHFVNQQFILQSNEYPDEGIHLDVNFGFMIYFFVPLLALFIAGVYVRSKSPNLPITEKLTTSLLIGLFYGIILSILSFFAGFSFEFSDFGSSIRFALDFSFIEALYNGFVLGFFFSFLGAYEKQDNQDTLTYGSYVQKSTAAFLKVFVVIGLVTSTATYLLIMDSVTTKFVFDSMPFIGVLLVLLQLSIYVLNVTMFNAFIMSVGNGMGFSNEAKYSLLGPSGQMEAREIFGFLDDKLIYLYLLAIVTAGIFVWIGKKLASGDIIKNVLIFSAIFAFIFTFISVNTNFSVEGLMDNGFVKVLIGFSLFQTFITSFLFSGVFSFIGAKYLGNK